MHHNSPYFFRNFETVMKIIPLILLFFSVALLADVPGEQQAEVNYLLNYVEKSGCVMNRNGSRHNGGEAVSHIQKKYDYFRDEINSTEDFIEYSATKSTMSGKYYTVECPGAEPVKSQDWLLDALQVYREGANR
mgnify:CR=1 FL=1